jgi:hypothetical protein
MAWGIHPPKDCCLGLSRKVTQRVPQPMTAPATAATIASPSFATFVYEMLDNK